MTFYDILGWIAAAFGMSAAFPQLYRLWRTRVSAGLSTRLWQLTAATTAAWAMHGFYVGGVQMQVPNIVCALMAVGILVLICMDRGRRVLPLLFMPAVLAVLLFGLDVGLGPVVFGSVVAVPAVVAQGSQFQFMRRSADLSGVSVPTLLVQVLVQLLWLIWGLGVGEQAIIVCASMMVLLCGANVVYYAARRVRGTAFPAPVVGEMPGLAAEAVA